MPTVEDTERPRFARWSNTRQTTMWINMQTDELKRTDKVIEGVE
jgi:hypothetical protein